MLGSFQHWRLCYQLLRLNRFICWLKTTKLPRNLKFSNLLSFLLRHPANAEGFPPVVTKTAHKNSSAFRQDTKQLLVLVDWRLNLKSKKKPLKYHLIISVESKAFRPPLYSASLETWRHSENSETENQTFPRQSCTITNMWTNEETMLTIFLLEREKWRKQTVCIEPLLHKLRNVLPETSTAKECATSKRGKEVNRARAALDPADQYCFLVEKTEKKSEANHLAQEKLSNWKLNFHI